MKMKVPETVNFLSAGREFYSFLSRIPGFCPSRLLFLLVVWFVAGAYLTLEAVGTFERAMTNGRGFIALAVMLFGRYTPLGAWGAALLFGFFNAGQTQLQLTGAIDIPPQFIGMLPYVLTIVVLAGFGGRSRPPAAVGQVYDPE